MQRYCGRRPTKDGSVNVEVIGSALEARRGETRAFQRRGSSRVDFDETDIAAGRFGYFACFAGDPKNMNCRNDEN